MEKALNPLLINANVNAWANGAIGNTSLSATNLNRIHSAVDTIDDRVIVLDIGKAEQSELLTCLGRWTEVVGGVTITHEPVEFNSETGVMTFNFKNHHQISYDLNIEKIPITFTVDSETGIIHMFNEDGEEIGQINVSALIKTYTFTDTDTIDFTVTDANGTKNVTADIKANSITTEMLSTEVTADLEEYVTEAHAYADDAEDNAILSESYARGETDSRTGENTDNAKYYKEKAEEAKAYVESAVGITEFSLDDTGHLIYENNYIYNFGVNDDGNLTWEGSADE